MIGQPLSQTIERVESPLHPCDMRGLQLDAMQQRGIGPARELVHALVIYKVHAEEFAIKLGATVVRITPAENDYEWTIELKIPIEIRQRQTPFPGERVRFAVKLVSREFEVSGIYRHKKNQFHIVQDDYGGEWKIQSIWQMKKV